MAGIWLLSGPQPLNTLNASGSAFVVDVAVAEALFRRKKIYRRNGKLCVVKVSDLFSASIMRF